MCFGYNEPEDVLPKPFENSSETARPPSPQLFLFFCFSVRLDSNELEKSAVTPIPSGRTGGNGRCGSRHSGVALDRACYAESLGSSHLIDCVLRDV